MRLHIQVSFNQATLGTSRRIAVGAVGFSASCTSLLGTLDVFSGSWPEQKSMLIWLHCHWRTCKLNLNQLAWVYTSCSRSEGSWRAGSGFLHPPATPLACTGTRGISRIFALASCTRNGEDNDPLVLPSHGFLV